jgi:hypothetical protein
MRTTLDIDGEVLIAAQGIRRDKGPGAKCFDLSGGSLTPFTARVACSALHISLAHRERAGVRERSGRCTAFIFGVACIAKIISHREQNRARAARPAGQQPSTGRSAGGVPEGVVPDPLPTAMPRRPGSAVEWAADTQQVHELCMLSQKGCPADGVAPSP